MFFIGKPTIAIAHPNIALIKYWGKKDQKLIIPTNNSLSITIDNFTTKTAVQFNRHFKHDLIIINDQPISAQQALPILHFIKLLRKKANKDWKVHIKSFSNIPLAAGLASSSAGFAALAAAASTNLKLPHTAKKLSILARRGSGSASRSIFGGLVEWQKGTSDQTSFAYPLAVNANWLTSIRIIAVKIVNTPKKISSRTGMQRSVATSPFYSQWIKTTNNDMVNIKQAINKNNFKDFGKIVEKNAMAMHALTISSYPSFSYLTDKSWQIITLVHQLRSQNVPCFFTIDAGPNIKVITQKNHLPQVIAKLQTKVPKQQLIITKAGSGIKIIP